MAQESEQKNFEKLIGISNDKKHLMRALTKLCTLLLNAKADTVDKIKKILKIAIETTQKIWQGSKQL